MLSPGTSLGPRWRVRTAPPAVAPGARLDAVDSQGSARDALVLSVSALDAVAVASAAQALAPLAASAGPTLLFPEDLALADGVLVEVLPRAGLRAAREFAAAQTELLANPSIVGALAARVADVASDLAALHAQGTAHGSIDASVLSLERAGFVRLVLSGFARARLAPGAPPPSPAADAQALARAFGELVLACAPPFDPTLHAAVGAIATSAPPDAPALVRALRDLAARCEAPAFDPFAVPAPPVQLTRLRNDRDDGYQRMNLYYLFRMLSTGDDGHAGKNVLRVFGVMLIFLLVLRYLWVCAAH